MSDELNELKARYARLELLYQVGNIIHSTLEPQTALQLIIEQAVRVMKASSGSVVLINPTSGFLEIHASMGLPPNAADVKLRLGQGITGWVARKGLPVRLGDVTKDPRYVSIRSQVHSEVAVPLVVNGEIRGVLNVDSERKEAFSAADQELMESLALSAAKVIHNTWLYEQLRLKARLFETLSRVGKTINSALNLDDALLVITREACLMMQARMCSLMMLDDTREWLELRASHGAAEAYRENPKISAEESLIGIVVRRRKPLQVENVQTSSRYTSANLARREKLFSLLSVPLIFAGEAIGTLSIYTGVAHKFSDEEIRILSALAELSAIAIEKARLYERVVDVEEQLRQNEKLSALGLLAAEVAHEIRNPLTVMKMLYHSLDLKFPRTDPRQKDAEILGEKIEHLNKIVEQILAFARTTEPDFLPVNLNEVIEELGLLVRHKLRNQNIAFIHKLDPRLPSVMADATQLEQAFLNLILNAGEAMSRSGGGKLTVSTSQIVPPEGGKPTHVAIEFRDTGEGMTEEQRRRAFSSVLSTTKAKGTGLGLAIVGRVVETHRGELQIRSRLGQGTAISVILPL
ncbi:MAG TPA: GAF domain-containing protein [Verrucomicrobiae bacterium]|jgi:signal transduction histidine kinase|nr:GAF domain-containing protein [Verrucomicrobiae bacterium]